MNLKPQRMRYEPLKVYNVYSYVEEEKKVRFVQYITPDQVGRVSASPYFGEYGFIVDNERETIIRRPQKESDSFVSFVEWFEKPLYPLEKKEEAFRKGPLVFHRISTNLACTQDYIIPEINEEESFSEEHKEALEILRQQGKKEKTRVFSMQEGVDYGIIHSHREEEKNFDLIWYKIDEYLSFHKENPSLSSSLHQGERQKTSPSQEEEKREKVLVKEEKIIPFIEEKLMEDIKKEIEIYHLHNTTPSLWEEGKETLRRCKEMEEQTKLCRKAAIKLHAKTVKSCLEREIKQYDMFEEYAENSG